MSQNKLLGILKDALDQELVLLSALTDEQYAKPGTGPFRSSIGQHIRHNLDHFEAFFDGLSIARIDYESRGRSELISESTAHARRKIETYMDGLDRIDEEDTTVLLVRKEDGQPEATMEWLHSSIGRELQFLLGHTVHHHAIICFLLSDFAIALPEGFGVAPSTQRHEAKSLTSRV